MNALKLRLWKPTTVVLILVFGLAVASGAGQVQTQVCGESYEITANSNGAEYVFLPCDGDDDATDLQRAADFGDVRLQGTYTITASVDVPSDRLISGGTIRSPDRLAVGHECLKLTGVSQVSIAGVTLRDCYVGVTARGASDVDISGASFTGNRDAIILIDADRFIVSNNSFRDQISDAIDCEPCRNSVFSLNNFKDNGGSHVLIKLKESHNNLVAQNVMLGGGGVTPNGSLNAIEVSVGASFNTVEGNVIDQPGHLGILIDGFAYTGSLCVDAECYWDTYQALTFRNSVKGNTIFNPGTSCVELSGGYFTLVEANTCLGGVNGPAFKISYGSHLTTIRNNTAVTEVFSQYPAFQIGEPGAPTEVQNNDHLLLIGNSAESSDIRMATWKAGYLIAGFDARETKLYDNFTGNALADLIDQGDRTFSDRNYHTEATGQP